MKRLATLTAAIAVTALALGGSLATAAAAGATTAGASASAQVPEPGGTIIRAPGAATLPTISLNWSGYAASTTKKFSYVHSQFVQPKLTCTGKPNRWTSNWVGLDGFTNQTVEQDGTFAYCAGPGNMTPHYIAWYEMYPAGSVSVFTVKPGDVIEATVHYTGGKFVLTIADKTSGKQHTDTAGCSTCQRASAEWIDERPALCNNTLTKCFLTALADFHTATMSDDYARLASGAAKAPGAFASTPIYMINNLKKGGFISLDSVSALSGPAFSVTWIRSGTTVPITLGARQ